MNSITLKSSDLYQIKDIAVKLFNNEDMRKLNNENMQVYLVLNALSEYLLSKGIEPNFKVKL